MNDANERTICPLPGCKSEFAYRKGMIEHLQVKSSKCFRRWSLNSSACSSMIYHHSQTEKIFQENEDQTKHKPPRYVSDAV